MFIEIDENGYTTGAWSETEQEWATFEIESLPEKELCFYKVIDGKLVYQEDRKEKLEKADENEATVLDLRQYLNETDWLIIRNLETGKAIPEDITEKRRKAREIISEIEEVEKL